MTKKKPLRVALYGRCSTDEERQEVLNQLLKLRESCEHYGWQVVREYVDYESGRKGRDKRRDFDRMLEEAGRREFDLVYFWRLNRFSREGIKQTIHYLDLLAGYGVKFKSYTEQYLDTENELIRHMLLGVLSYFAAQQAVEISENTKAGLERARKQGKKLGRPPLPYSEKQKILRTFKETKSLRETSRKLKQPLTTVKRVVDRLQNGG
jgi:DNA invertase Pin-like site-specific DNA recombinase